MAGKPNIKTLKASAKEFGHENMAGGSIKAATDSLHDFFIETFGEDALVRCPVCNNDGPEKNQAGEDVTSCPFCGAQFTDAPAAEAPTAKKSPAKSPGGKTQKVAKKKGAPKEEYIATTEQKEELASVVQEIDELRQNMNMYAYDIGVKLADINDRGLWKGLGYDSFFAYCKHELDFSRASAYKYMLCSREFDRDTFQTLGVKKGELIASAPDRHRKKLLTAAKKGSSFSTLRAKLDKLEGKTSSGKGANGKGEPTTGKITLMGRVKEGGDIEIAWLSSKSHEPITRKDIKGKYAILPCTDEVEVVLTPADNELGLVANFRKVGEESEATETEETPEVPEETEAPEAEATA
jgi:hypothetical protein